MKALPIKNEFGEAILELSRLCFTGFFTGSSRVTAKPCWVFCVITDVSGADKVAKINLRNGETGVSPILVTLYGEGSCPIFQGALPLYFNKGLYLEFDEDTTGVTIQYLNDSP